MTKKKPSKAVSLDDIVCDERCQSRSAMNQEAVDEYADIYREGDVDLPALEVAKVDGELVLLDGFHRFAAARAANHGFVRVTVTEECDIGRALWLAAAVNQGHGVRRTSADKRQAIRLALKSEIGFEQSLRDLAEHVGVSHMTVSRVRAEFEADLLAKLEAAAEPDDTGAGVTELQPDASSDAQEATPAGTDPQADETPSPTSIAEPSCLERAQAIDRIASHLHKAVKKERKEVERISAGAFPDLVELADDMLEAAKAFASAAAAAVKEEEGEARIAS
jgi:hypothetical protein